jgi:nitrile hydratase
MPGPHDVGGKDFGPVDRRDHPRTPFDVNVDTLQQLLGGGGARLYRVDELRRCIESLAPGDYYRFSYYQKWVSAMRMLMLEKGVFSAAELEQRLSRHRGAGR